MGCSHLGQMHETLYECVVEEGRATSAAYGQTLDPLDVIFKARLTYCDTHASSHLSRMEDARKLFDIDFIDFPPYIAFYIV